MLKGSSDIICTGFSCQEQNMHMGTTTTDVTFLWNYYTELGIPEVVIFLKKNYMFFIII